MSSADPCVRRRFMISICWQCFNKKFGGRLVLQSRYTSVLSRIRWNVFTFQQISAVVVQDEVGHALTSWSNKSIKQSIHQQNNYLFQLLRGAGLLVFLILCLYKLFIFAFFWTSEDISRLSGSRGWTCVSILWQFMTLGRIINENDCWLQP